MPTFVLVLNYWLHLLATIAWLGGLAMLTFVVWPGLSSSGDGEPDRILPTFGLLERRFRPIANISLVVLLITGMIQMGGDPHYKGFLIIGSDWSFVMLLKHAIIGGMIIVTTIIQGVVLPALHRTLFARPGGPPADLESGLTHHRRLKRLTILNLGLGVLVLLSTAVLTAL